jgi:hypothetical protein
MGKFNRLGLLEATLHTINENSQRCARLHEKVFMNLLVDSAGYVFRRALRQFALMAAAMKKRGRGRLLPLGFPTGADGRLGLQSKA